MKVKVLILSLLFSLMIPLGVFAEVITTPEPNNYNNGLLDDITLIKSNNLPISSYDNDLSTGESIGSIKTIEFNYYVDITGIYINRGTITPSNNYLTIRYRDENQDEMYQDVYDVTDSIGYVDLDYNNVVDIRISQQLSSNTNVINEIDFFGSYDRSNPVNPEDIEEPEPEDTQAPENISNIDYTITESSISFTYDLPIDEDFSHLEIYRDSVLLIENHQLSTFTDRNLESDKQYYYTFKSVDLSGNVSTGNTVGVKTNIPNDETPPEVPTGLKATPFHSAFSLSWNQNEERDLAGYFIYLNGEKYNMSPIVNNQYDINNLVNGVNYEIQVSAIDTSGNESERTSIVLVVPSENELPIFSLSHDLTDVAKSTENWFSELWLILAFAVAIPLSFMIAQRVKSLFLA